MAKKQKAVKAPRPETLWEYECIVPQPGRPSRATWIPEDDERSASYKAVSEKGTGRVRSKEINTGENNEWVVKAQTILTHVTKEVVTLDEEPSYDKLAELVLMEVIKRYPDAANGDQKAVLEQGRYENLGPHVWTVTWEGGHEWWTFEYHTSVQGVDVFAYNERALMVTLKDPWDF